ncbi:MAG: hypothetical protein LC624_11190 [Halobacteriales archaeon]|nr:hypothetical protein [Halobacteriales archaeon]
MAMLGKRFLAVLAVVALVGGAFVGMTLASGQWNVVGTGLEPGQGYGVQVVQGNDRVRLSLENVTSDPLATFSLWGPDGNRAGYFEINGATKSADIVTGPGAWLVFVYKSQGADLTLSVHGTDSGVPMVPAGVERREVNLGSVNEQNLDRTFTAVLGHEPALAGVYLEGSARGISSELRTEKGIVEVVHDEQTDAVQGGLIVDAKGERTTFPGNLQSGAFTAHVTATEIRGALQLVAIYLTVPDFPEPVVSMPDEEEKGSNEATPPPSPHKASSPPSHYDKHSAMAKHMAIPMDVADCGTADAGVPYAISVDRPGLLNVKLNETTDPVVSLYDPQDDLMGTVELKKKGDEGTLPMAFPGDYVLYSRGATVDVHVIHAETCKLIELKTKVVPVADISGDVLGGGASNATFSLEMPPLLFGLMPNDPTTVVVDGSAVFKGPEGDGAASHIDIGLGLVDGGMPIGDFLPFGSPDHQDRQHGGMSSQTTVDAAKLLRGDWTVDFSASAMQGSLVAYALEYVRGTDAGTEDNGDSA